jgi:hypothetical protein
MLSSAGSSVSSTASQADLTWGIKSGIVLVRDCDLECRTLYAQSWKMDVYSLIIPFENPGSKARRCLCNWHQRRLKAARWTRTVCERHHEQSRYCRTRAVRL